MDTIDINGESCPRELRAGVAAIKAEFPHRFGRARRALPVTFAKLPADARVSLQVERQPARIQVRYRHTIHAFRALGRLLGGSRPPLTETARFDMLGVMLDVSRNAVLTERTVQSFLCRFALMGVNTLMLYAEDTYEVPGERFFGYLRGRYTGAELRRLDDFADALGVEMFPCIQTLAHLEQMLQSQAYAPLRDTAGVLLAGEDQTYALLEQMIRAASAPFRSPRIHLGMDEAHGMGTGEYLRRHGERNGFEIFNRHLARVRAICRRRGLRPMIWSDMYFRISSKRSDYYDTKAVIPHRVAAAIPQDVQLVYWDYYHHTPAFYRDWIARHRRLGSEPVMASGVWTYGRFWAALPHTFSNVNACLRACQREKLREVFLTAWNDDGTECDYYSALPGVQYFAEHGYADRVDDRVLRANFAGSCGANWDDWLKASRLDSVPCLADPRRNATNVSKWLLWQDPLLPLMQPQLEGVSLRRHYRRLAAQLRSTGTARLRFPAAVAAVLALKSDLAYDVADAYRRQDRAKLRRLLQRTLPALRRAVVALWRAHRAMWLATYRPFGWEVVEGRYGGLLLRLDTLRDRLAAWQAGRIASIPELEARFEKIYRDGRRQLPYVNYDRVATPSCIK